MSSASLESGEITSSTYPPQASVTMAISHPEALVRLNHHIRRLNYWTARMRQICAPALALLGCTINEHNAPLIPCGSTLFTIRRVEKHEIKPYISDPCSDTNFEKATSMMNDAVMYSCLDALNQLNHELQITCHDLPNLVRIRDIYQALLLDGLSLTEQQSLQLQLEAAGIALDCWYHKFTKKSARQVGSARILYDDMSTRVEKANRDLCQYGFLSFETWLQDRNNTGRPPMDLNEALGRPWLKEGWLVDTRKSVMAKKIQKLLTDKEVFCLIEHLGYIAQEELIEKVSRFLREAAVIQKHFCTGSLGELVEQIQSDFGLPEDPQN
ncbi:hypothetical protein BT63DRAFT_471061 [Microthyrium microscopicum]|uniref:Uncharacterized protein n=1 Tax=Microthyrium microscopicum TaxID=703497 RepID=A0A6A6UFC4_9PEZI|nr:hypothetical protein BT63DRAFT_471061 [Microthyrium microscopicum]